MAGSVPMNIAVADAGGHLLAFGPMDGAIFGSIKIALAKAKTSMPFTEPGQNPWECCTPSGPAPAAELTNGGLIAYADGAAVQRPGRDTDGAVGYLAACGQRRWTRCMAERGTTHRV